MRQIFRINHPISQPFGGSFTSSQARGCPIVNHSKPLVGMVMICYDCVYHMMFDWEKPPFEKPKGNHLKKLDWPLRVSVSRKHPISDTLLGHPIIIYHIFSSSIIIYHHGIISLVENVINPTNHPKWLAIHDNDWWLSLGPGRRTRCCSCGRKGRPFVVISRWKMIDTLWLFNIAMENGPFIVDFPIKNGDFP